jgi:hypothetical protein
MHSDELIKSLSDNGSKDLLASAQWIKPIPDNAYALIEKIDMALNIVKFAQSRRSEKGAEVSNHHLDSLIRLKSEISNILDIKLT